ncbi:hypothetical protein D3C78_1404680 [compost metagenome]
MILLISFKKKRIEISANTKALINPAMKNGSDSIVKYCQFFIRDTRLAPAMIGTAIIKVKSAAARWLIPRSTPPDIVEPEREKPGHKDKH